MACLHGAPSARPLQRPLNSHRSSKTSAAVRPQPRSSLHTASQVAPAHRASNAGSHASLLPALRQPRPREVTRRVLRLRLSAAAAFPAGSSGGSESSSRRGAKVIKRDPAPRIEDASNVTVEHAELGSDDQSRRPNQLEKLVSKLLQLVVKAAFFVYKVVPHRLRLNKLSGWAVLLGVGAAFMFGAVSPGGYATSRAPQEVVYSQFLDAVNGGHVRAVRFDDAANRVYFDLQQPAAQGSKAEKGTAPTATAPTVAPRQYYAKKIDDPGLVNVLMAAGVEFGAMRATVTGAVLRVVGTALALWIPLTPLIFIMRRALSGKTNSRAKKTGGKPAAPAITFRDVAGVENAKEELREVVACLKDAQRYARLNAKMPSGVLLCGSPGTGKTLLAKAVAGEAGVPFFAASASEFVELFVGRGAARIRDLFAEARKKAPCVVFIDELDAVGGKRGLGLNEERDQTLNQLLTELDGFEGRAGVLLLAATNRPEVLDPALTRPGRLSRRVVVPLPDQQGRADILAVHLRGTPLPLAIDKPLLCQTIARMTRGFSGAELANVVNEAALLAGRAGKDAIELGELMDGVQRTKYGVNGGGSSLLPGVSGWRRRLQEWLIQKASTQQQMRTSPMGPS